ncbi:YifB family Mg chelatase-like AAA ATPase [Sebaldella sp. S0638]|uniref:YifB family Mg chelatase-like AAA ATPase n=1 Tax=Sebaldella sp. S0638 TaxID=2957809 RepID=UPI00209F1532|nr:YifB family Mg chelatase-like AAA ATPase [Sebaldella sp. S0638]MCP1224541.1 YifB family Mg chelatase-like AAA ATPase [Sebaldella sp. S0638]
MAITILSASFTGMNSYIVNVEVDIFNGLPGFSIVGMGDTAIIESRERIRSSLKNIDVIFPAKKVVVNLSPADIRKKGSQFDLSICTGILANLGYIENMARLEKYLILGELSLNCAVKSCKGIINAVILAKNNNLEGIIIPYENYKEASLIKGIKIVPVKNLNDVFRFLNEGKYYTIKNTEPESELHIDDIDFSDIKGQSHAKRAAEIAAAGGHNLFLIGDPGSGKSMIAKRVITILPHMHEEEIIETTRIYSIVGMLSPEFPVVSQRPFRAPHHTASTVSLVGGSQRPGEISLALNGILFLDELGEYPLKLLEVLRQPLEDGKVTISRADFSAVYPVSMILITASNPSPSGYFPDDPRCTDTLRDIKRYIKKFSGPLLDRMDLYVELKKLSHTEILSMTKGESSSEIKKRVLKARKIQYFRYKSIKLNKDMKKKDIEKYCELTDEMFEFLNSVIEKFDLSARAYDKVLKVARTIADLEGTENIQIHHLSEALNYRKK